jgi:hypothetical protein
MNRMKKGAPRLWMAIALIAALGLGLGVASGAQPTKSGWVAAWGFSIQGLAPAATVVTNETVRMIARPTISGERVRVRLDNTFGTVPLTIGRLPSAIATTARSSCRERSVR